MLADVGSNPSAFMNVARDVEKGRWGSFPSVRVLQLLGQECLALGNLTKLCEVATMKKNG